MHRDLIRACTKGDVARVQELWGKVSGVEDNLNVIYSAAAVSGSRDMVKFMWKKGIPVDYYDGEALIYLCDNITQKLGEKRSKQLDMVRFLIAEGIPATIRGSEACICAARNGDLELLDILVSRGANPLVQEDHALTLAASNGHPDVVEYLISKGANPNTENGEPLYFAVTNGCHDCVQVLFEHGAGIIDNDEVLLDVAEQNEDMRMIKLLVERGCCAHLMQ